jgi:hypothetical protein
VNVPVVLDPLLDDATADAIVALWHGHPSYQQYSNEGFPTQFAPELAQRYDAAANFVRTGGRFGRREDPMLLAARTNYFRETYIYGDEVFAPAATVLRDHPGFVEAAVAIHQRPVVTPAIVYANILLPGQELAIHTDVPEFRGANRRVVPQWLLVVMGHSGLFERWRMPIATAIAYFGTARGGGLAYYPDGPDGPPQVYPAAHNTAVVLDTDRTFHGVDRVDGDDTALADLRPGMRLHHDGDQRWSVRDDEAVVARYRTDDLRYSVSWKAYCFADDAEHALWLDHSDDLTLEAILERLVDDLVDRGRLGSPADRPSDAELGRLLIGEYIRFPAPAPTPA